MTENSENNGNVRSGAPALRSLPRLPASVVLYVKRDNVWRELRVPVTQIASFEAVENGRTELIFVNGEKTTVLQERDALYEMLFGRNPSPDGVIDLREMTGLYVPPMYRLGDRVSEDAYYAGSIEVSGRSFALCVADRSVEGAVLPLSAVFNHAAGVLDITSEEELVACVAADQYRGEWFIPTIPMMDKINDICKKIGMGAGQRYAALPASGKYPVAVEGGTGKVVNKNINFTRPVYLMAQKTQQAKVVK